MRQISVTAFSILLITLCSTPLRAAEVSSANISLDPVHDAAGCALITGNGYAGMTAAIYPHCNCVLQRQRLHAECQQ